MSQYIVTHSLIFSYLRVYEKENERKIKTYRVPGKVVNGFNSSSNLTARLEGDLTTVSSLRRHKEERLGEGEGEGNDSKCSSDKPVDCDSSTIILTPQVKVEAFSSRNQFDRASQLRRSRKKSRRKSDAGPGNTSSISAGRDESVLSSEEVFSTSRAEYSSNYGNLI